MGQKVSPHGLRVGVIKDWESKWYADKKSFADFLAAADNHTVVGILPNQLAAFFIAHLPQYGDPLAFRVIGFVFLHRLLLAQKGKRHLLNIQRNGRGGRKPRGLNTGAMNDVFGLSARFYNKIFFKSRRTHTGEIGNNIPLGQAGHGLFLFREHGLNALAARRHGP